MEVLYLMWIYAFLFLATFIGFIVIYAKYSKLKEKPLTYYELLQLPDGTEVMLLQYVWKTDDSGYPMERGKIYTRKDGTKAIDVYNGDIELTEADIWLDDGTQKVVIINNGGPEPVVQMVKTDDGEYVPLECCSMTNPATSGGISVIDDIDLPCGSDCYGDCNTCVIQRIMNDYAEQTGQTKQKGVDV